MYPNWSFFSTHKECQKYCSYVLHMSLFYSEWRDWSIGLCALYAATMIHGALCKTIVAPCTVFFLSNYPTLWKPNKRITHNSVQEDGQYIGH